MNVDEALEMVFGEDLEEEMDSGGELDIPEDPAVALPRGVEELDSGGELEIPEDPAFPLPPLLNSSSEESSSEESSPEESSSKESSSEESDSDHMNGEVGGEHGRGTGYRRGRGRGMRGRGRGMRGSRGRSTTGGRVQLRRGRGRGRPRQGKTPKTPTSSTIPWKETQVETDIQPLHLPFGEVPGPHLDLPDNPQPVDFLSNFLDQDVLGHIVEETNRYASERLQKLQAAGKLTRRSRFLKWTPLTVNELEGFLALVLNMGIITVPRVEDYWKTSMIAEIPFFHQVMSRDRFLLIFWLLHVSHTTTSPPKRIDKLHLLLEMLMARFQRRYTPTRNLSVDETLLRFRGHFVGKQYMPKKPAKWGIKAFSLACSNGYLLNTLVYTGAETLAEASAEYATLPQPSRVVMHLLEQYLHRGYHVFTDRYYTSIPLANALETAQTSLTGTIMRDRVGLPDPVRAGARLAVGETAAYRHSSSLVVSWQAKKSKAPIIMLSTQSSAEMVDVRGQRKPAVVHRYNQHMNGVDIVDQYSVSYPFTRKTLKWWRKVFFWLIEVCVSNSYILYRQTVTRPLSHIAYRQSIVESLAQHYLSTSPSRPRPGRPRKRLHSDATRLNGQLHLLSQGPTRECVVCSNPAGGRRKRTSFYCKTCPDSPNMCPAECFELYHTQVDFRP